MKRLAETPVQNLTLWRKKCFQGIIPCFFFPVSVHSEADSRPDGGHRHAVPDLIPDHMARPFKHSEMKDIQ